MYNEEDVILIKQRIEALKATQASLREDLQKATKENEQLQVLKSMVGIEAKRQRDQDIQAMAKEKEDLHAQILGCRDKSAPEVKAVRIARHKLHQREEILTSHVEKLDVNQTTIDALEEELIRSENASGPLDAEFAQAKKYIHFFKRIRQMRRTLFPIALRLEDLENQHRQLRADIDNKRELISIDRAFIEKFTSGNEDKTAELGRVAAELQNYQDEIKMNDFQRGRIYSELSALATEMDDLNSVTKKENEEREAKVRQCEAELKELHDAIEARKHKLHELTATVEGIPEHAKAVMQDQEIMLGKKKQLATEIQKKIDAFIFEFAQKENQSPTVMKLTKALAQHWEAHERLIDATEKGEKRLHEMQATVERKRFVATELRVQNYQFKETGMKHLDAVYEAALALNRKMGKRMRVLQRQLDVEVAENKQFTRELQERRNAK